MLQKKVMEWLISSLRRGRVLILTMIIHQLVSDLLATANNKKPFPSFQLLHGLPYSKISITNEI